MKVAEVRDKTSPCAVPLTGANTIVLQIVDVSCGSDRLRLGSASVPAERACQRHGVELRRTTRKGSLTQAKLLAVSARGDVLELLVVEALEHLVGDPLESPGLVPAGGHLAPSKAHLLEVVCARSRRQRIAATLRAEIDLEKSYLVTLKARPNLVDDIFEDALQLSFSDHELKSASSDPKPSS